MGVRSWVLETGATYMVIEARREYGINPANGVDFAGRWVARYPGGDYLDSDKYRNDLEERLLTRGYITKFIG